MKIDFLLKGKKIKVKYFQQTTSYSCGPACLRMIVSAFGKETTEDELIELCGTTLFGTTCNQIQEAAINLGFYAETFVQISKKEVVNYINDKLPLIALVDAAELYGSMPVGHFVVILELKQKIIIYHDPAIGANQKIHANTFLNAWQKFDFRGVLIWK